MSLSMFIHLISVVRVTDIPRDRGDQLFRETRGRLLVTRSVTCIVPGRRISCLLWLWLWLIGLELCPLVQLYLINLFQHKQGEISSIISLINALLHLLPFPPLELSIFTCWVSASVLQALFKNFSYGFHFFVFLLSVLRNVLLNHIGLNSIPNRK